MELTAQTRDKFGRAVKALRRQGFIPAELYGHGLKNIHLAVDAKEFRKVFKEAGESTVLSLAVAGGKGAAEKHNVLVHDVVRDPLSGEVTHLDFYEVRMDEKLTAHVPLEFVGEAPAVKEKGGLLNRSLTELEVEALPKDLPHHLTVDVSVLAELNQSVRVRDIVVPKNVRVLIEPEAVVATVTGRMKEEEVAPAPAVDVTTVAVETEEKKAEREKEQESGSEG